MPALPPISPRDVAHGLRDAATHVLFSRDFDVWEYYGDDDDNHDHDCHWLDDDDDRCHRRLSREMIAVIVAGVAIVVGLVGGIVYLCSRRRQRRRGKDHAQDIQPLMMQHPEPYNNQYSMGPQHPAMAYTGQDPATGFPGEAPPPPPMPYDQGARDLTAGESPPAYNQENPTSR